MYVYIYFCLHLISRVLSPAAPLPVLSSGDWYSTLKEGWFLPRGDTPGAVSEGKMGKKSLFSTSPIPSEQSEHHPPAHQTTRIEKTLQIAD